MGFQKFNQTDFRKGFQAADHVLTLTIKRVTDKYLSRHQKLDFCFVDFRKAYKYSIV